MAFRAFGLIRNGLNAVWLLGILALSGVSLLPHVLPAVDHQMYIVRGGSMAPAIPVGAVIFVHRVAGEQLSSGDVITFGTANGIVVTHRVVGIEQGATGRSFVTKGDASQERDAGFVSQDAIIGRVEHTLPALGFLLVNLGSPPGLLAVTGVLASLLLASWFVGELMAAMRPAIARGTVGEPTG
jgi:signal peptidase I